MALGIGVGVIFNSKVRRIIVQDSFNRADNTSSLGNANTGQTWTVSSLAWGIITNQAYSVSTTSTEAAFINSGASDVVVSSRVIYSVNEGLVIRVTDGANHLIVRLSSTGLGLFRNVATTPTQIGNYAFTPTVGIAYNLKVICVGSTVKVFLDGTEVISVTETFNQSAIRHGIRAAASTGGRFDDFKVEAL